MKKLLVLMLLLLSLTLFTGCMHFQLYSAVGFVETSKNDKVTVSFMSLRGSKKYTLNPKLGETTLVYSGEIEEGSMEIVIYVTSSSSHIISVKAGEKVSDTIDISDEKVYIELKSTNTSKGGSFSFELK